jgi:hypothetical protein
MKSDPKQNKTTMKNLWNEDEIQYVTIPIMESGPCKWHTYKFNGEFWSTFALKHLRSL